VSKKSTPIVPTADATGTPQHTAHEPVTSPAAIQRTERMKVATKPNAGEPLTHRNRSKAGRKG
jgi:hypothetical protein